MKILVLCIACSLLFSMLGIEVSADAPGKGDLPPVDQLPSIKELPDPLTFKDGTKVKSAEDWKRRREELKALIQFYEYGHLPPAPGNVKAMEIGTQNHPTLPATERRLKLEM